MKTIQQGAEAKILLSVKKNFIIKDRISKGYRILELDKKIRKLRTRSESKLLEKASNIINSPKPCSIPESYKIKMPFIKGKKLSEYLGSFPLKKQKEICREIGKSISKLHDANIIHGDLTTSNMILVENLKKIIKHDNLTKSGFQINSFSRVGGWESVGKSEKIPKFRIFFIDFGLGFISHKIEDKAVDLHLLKQALEAKHFKNWKLLFGEVIKGYKNSKKSDLVLKQFEKVEKRGRYKDKY
jgi:TP53 regulating kinase-like protein